VIGDHSQLEQVVVNLVLNARDALADAGGGHIAVRTRTEGEYVVLEVADDGPGIPAELRERVFEPYFTTKIQGADRGTGLGLATVFAIVEGHHGTIEIDTGLADRGTTMRVRLPAATGRFTAPEPPAARPAVPAGSGTILVVDDDPIVMRAVAAALRSVGYTTLEAADGARAVELFREHRSKVRGVVLDLVMPRMSGRATYAALRELDPEVAVLVMSANAPAEDIEALRAQGIRGFIAKPHSVDLLARAVADAITPVRDSEP
jgi:CheY-like chemotaxis protein